MALEDLCNVVETTLHKTKDFAYLLSKNEADTRYVLIDPLLRALGWETENSESVCPEYFLGQGSADYAIFDKKKPLVFIEAKPLCQSLQQGIVQSINYCLQAGRRP